MSELSYEAPTRISQVIFRSRKRVLRLTKRLRETKKDSLTCSVCHALITFETEGICADENGKAVHADCHIMQMIAAGRSPVPSLDNTFLK